MLVVVVVAVAAVTTRTLEMSAVVERVRWTFPEKECGREG